MYRALVLASRFADWLTLQASKLAGATAAVAQVADEKAYLGRVAKTAAAVSASRTALLRAERTLNDAYLAHTANSREAAAAHPLVA